MTTPLVRLVRDGSPDVELAFSQGGTLIASWITIDTPGAGSFTYRLQMAGQGGYDDGGTEATITSGTLVAFVVKR